MYPEPVSATQLQQPLASWYTPATFRSAPSAAAKTTALGAHVVSAAQHLSQLLYAVPSERVRRLLPPELVWQGFALAEMPLADTPQAWLSVVSYVDQPAHPLSLSSALPFEQTAYRVALKRDGRLYQWLLNLTVGSLSAVGPRQLWPLPWHLGAMELSASYDETAHRYQSYRLHTQSEHINATWVLADTGTPVSATELKTTAPPALLAQPNLQDCFVRRDRQLGQRQTQFRVLEATRGQLLHARCDWLERAGLLTTAELQKPHAVWLSRLASFEQTAPMIMPAAFTELRAAA